MNEFEKRTLASFGELATHAWRSVWGFLAVSIVILGILAWMFFKGESVLIRFAAFSLMAVVIISVVGISWHGAGKQEKIKDSFINRPE